MPDEARKWMETHDPLDSETFKEYNARMHIVRLLAQNEGYGQLLGSANKDVERLSEYADKLEADRRALVAVLRLLNIPIAYCAYPGFEKVDALGRVERMREAVQALGAELQEEIDAQA